MNPDTYASRYSRITEHQGITMTLIGYWIDLAAYYRGSDNNAWAYQSRWTNCGPAEEFRARLRAGKVRGKLRADVQEVAL
jgi:hypothetical protein